MSQISSEGQDLLTPQQKLEKVLAWLFEVFRNFFDHVIDFNQLIGGYLNKFFTVLGKRAYDNIDIIKGWGIKLYHFLRRRHGHRLSRYWIRFIRKAKRVLCHFRDKLSPPFVKLYSIGHTLVLGVTESRGEPFWKRVRHFFHVVWIGVKSNTNVIKTVFHYALPVAGIAVLVYTVNFAGSLTFAVRVTYNGSDLGYVTNETVVNTAKEIVQGRMVYLDDTEHVSINPTYEVEIASTEDVLTEYQLADSIIQLSGDEMVEADGLYIDGTFYGALDDQTAIQSTLDGILASYQTDETVENVSFVNNIEVIPGLYLTDNIKPEEDLIGLLNSQVQAESYYTVVDGDTPLGVAEKTSMRYSDLKALNPSIEDSTYFRAGAQLLLTRAEAFLPVEVTKTVVYPEAIPFETEVTESAKLPKDEEKVEQEGVAGENQITAKVTYVNNNETAREILSTEVTREPVTKKVTKGTAVINTDASYDGPVSNSGFINPLPGCYVSSSYGSRWNAMHGGLDLCIRGGTFGKPIYAAAGGTISFAGNSGGYGKLVKVNHGGGVETWYGHTSSIVVSSGQVVSQGQLIAYAGATGQVTGPHLHLEVRVNGIRKNPLNYIPGL